MQLAMTSLHRAGRLPLTKRQSYDPFISVGVKGLVDRSLEWLWKESSENGRYDLSALDNMTEDRLSHVYEPLFDNVSLLIRSDTRPLTYHSLLRRSSAWTSP